MDELIYYLVSQCIAIHASQHSHFSYTHSWHVVFNA